MSIDLGRSQKIIVGEGPSDSRFFNKFCEKNTIGGFQFANPSSIERAPGGWENFGNFLKTLPLLPKFETLTDVVLFCDSADNPTNRFAALKRQIESVVASGPEGQVRFRLSDPNAVAFDGKPRLHVFMVPKTDKGGGLESLCLEAAAGAFDEPKKTIMQAVDEFAEKVCKLADGNPWTIEKTDKLRLQAFISAVHPRKPDQHFYRLFDAAGDQLIPLDSNAFDEIKNFLSAIAAL